jgi:biopolymer transport protein ExbB
MTKRMVFRVPYIRLGMHLIFALAMAALPPLAQSLSAQQASETASPSAEPAPVGDDGPAERPPAPPDKSINIFSLYMQGGIFMIPITGMSILTGTMIIERFLGLRQQKVLPPELVTALGQLGSSPGTFDPRKAYRVCQQFPSAAASVVRAMLLKVGRPLPEVEHTVSEASDREADRLYRNVRWLNLSAAVTPLLGLLGTVQGMIIAFHMTATIDASQNRTEALATGIYTALVTTFAGLVVAIPAAMFSHYFEGRIQSLFHDIDELASSLLPQVERYEGRVRFGRGAEDLLPAEESQPPVPPPIAAPVAAGK